ncbi:hypothetical protein F7725_018202 [Dissostichus mawsoni]|uniref:Ig-like domain-containing protein n=1 Tax=Dissostichus mawsoni TaxID=36200 RepID=A0A7J5XQT5_DISMA|nr:hypothetical protein F7725_018202 [Dissostichus mawsoni]
MTAEYSGLYVCTAKLQKPPLSTHAEVIVTLAPDVWFSQKFRHLCISEGFPSKSITLSLLDAQDEYFVTNNLLHHAVDEFISGIFIIKGHFQINVVKKPVITGNTTIKDGDDLNLTCSVESFPPSVITWTKHGSIKNLPKETKIILHNDTGTATLIILMIFSTSGCVVQSEVLTCVCVSEGFPLPTIKWPLLDTHTEYSVTTNFSNHAVHISITLTLKDRNYTTVECISSNIIGEVKENLIVTRKVLKQYDQHGPCEVLFWVGVAAVSLIVNVICIILMTFLWYVTTVLYIIISCFEGSVNAVETFRQHLMHTRKKVKPNQEDRTYMSIKKTEVSSDYDVIAQPLN